MVVLTILGVPLNASALGDTQVISISFDSENYISVSEHAFSNDGRYVVYTEGYNNGYDLDWSNAVILDRQNGTYQRIGNYADTAIISSTGKYIATVQNYDYDKSLDIWDRSTGTKIRTVAFGGNTTGIGSAVFSDNKNYIFFSTGKALLPEDTNYKGDVYRLDIQTGLYKLISVSESGALSNGDAYSLDVSADGRYVVFITAASNLVPGDTNGVTDIILRDVDGNKNTLISRGIDGQASSADDYTKISSDGNIIAFTSSGSNLVNNDTNSQSDVFLWEKDKGITLISKATAISREMVTAG